MNTRLTQGKLPWKGKIPLQGNGMDAIPKRSNEIISGIKLNKIYQCMTCILELIGIHKDSMHKELVEIYNQQTKVGKAN